MRRHARGERTLRRQVEAISNKFKRESLNRPESAITDPSVALLFNFI